VAAAIGLREGELNACRQPPVVNDEAENVSVSGDRPLNSSCRNLALTLLFGQLLFPLAAVADNQVDAQSVVDYVLGCRKANGAFGPADQQYTDAAWNYPAVKTLQLLEVKIERPQSILQHGLGSPRGHVGYGHWLFFHQHGIRHALGASGRALHEKVRLIHQGDEVRYYGSPFGTGGKTFFQAGGAGLDSRDDTANELGFYNLSSLYYVLAGLNASGRSAANTGQMMAFLGQRQAPCGGFADVRAAEGKPVDEAAHVAHTWHAIAARKLLGAEVPAADRCAEFLRSCQVPSGAFRWSPRGAAPGNHPDVYYAWAAVTALHTLGSKPADANRCVHWLNSLQNADGGFGDRPGWRSRLYSTYYAVETLALLADDGDPRSVIARKRVGEKKAGAIAEGDFQIYQALLKAPVVQPEDLPALQRRGFDLLGIKSSDFELAARLRKAAQSLQPPMDVVLCPEAYSHRARWLDGPELHHIGNVTLAPEGNGQQRAVWRAADAAGQKGLSWPEYQQRVIQPLRRRGSLFYPEQDFEMEFAYSAYDDGAVEQLGYNAMLAGFNWSPRDFIRVFPWRERYVDKLVMVADADAHGDLEKWSPQLDHTRMLFLARRPTYADFQDAAKNGRVACVIHDAEGVPSRATYYGPQPVVDYVERRVEQWKWWQ